MEGLLIGFSRDSIWISLAAELCFQTQPGNCTRGGFCRNTRLESVYDSRLDFRQINHIQRLIKSALRQLQNPRMMRKENWLNMG